VFRRAYGKINLALSVGSPYPAEHPLRGMHPIASWMHAIDLFDDVFLEPRSGENRGASRRPARDSEVEVAWAPDAPLQTEIDWPVERDLAARALRLLEAHSGEKLPVRIRVQKRIPVGSGLGGGSSDAAAVMLALNEVFALGLTLQELIRLSRSLGSDVAFFLDEQDPPRPALVGGTGQQIERTSRLRSHLVLACPAEGCATPSVYEAYDRLGHGEVRTHDVRDLASGGKLEPAKLFNDLTSAASEVLPELASLRSRLAAACSEPVHLTGSGSTLFLVTEDPDGVAERLAIAAPEVTLIKAALV
jgi:4-diphosphocytidyl-2-C-methyl-D-erythritol kinase